MVCRKKCTMHFLNDFSLHFHVKNVIEIVIEDFAQSLAITRLNVIENVIELFMKR